MDGIRNEVLKVLPRKQIVALCNIINAIMRLRHFPVAWKKAVVIFILKPGKPLNSTDAYRTISLLPNLVKLAESVILTKLTKFTEEKNILPDT